MTLQEIFSLWSTLPDSKFWCEPGWACMCAERPNCYLIGADDPHGGEVFAVVDVMLKRVLDEDEFPTGEDSPRRWIEVEPKAKKRFKSVPTRDGWHERVAVVDSDDGPPRGA